MVIRFSGVFRPYDFGITPQNHFLRNGNIYLWEDVNAFEECFGLNDDLRVNDFHFLGPSVLASEYTVPIINEEVENLIVLHSEQLKALYSSLFNFSINNELLNIFNVTNEVFVFEYVLQSLTPELYEQLNHILQTQMITLPEFLNFIDRIASEALHLNVEAREQLKNFILLNFFDSSSFISSEGSVQTDLQDRDKANFTSSILSNAVSSSDNQKFKKNILLVGSSIIAGSFLVKFSIINPLAIIIIIKKFLL